MSRSFNLEAVRLPAACIFEVFLGNVDSVKTGGNRSVPDPLVSIIIVAFNACAALGPLLASIIPLLTPETELIVVDGGSEDGTVQLLERQENAITHWKSEKDAGIYDAMNKAILAARGTFVYHINAGDSLWMLPIQQLREADAHHVDVAAFCVSIDGERIFVPRSGFALSVNNTWHHQGTFYRRVRFSPYDLRYKVFADFDANQRLQLAGAKSQIFKEVVALHTTDGASHARNSVPEFFQVIRNNYGVTRMAISWLGRKIHGMTRRLHIG
jgi:hypothetical protein